MVNVNRTMKNMAYEKELSIQFRISGKRESPFNFSQVRKTSVNFKAKNVIHIKTINRFTKV